MTKCFAVKPLPGVEETLPGRSGCPSKSIRKECLNQCCLSIGSQCSYCVRHCAPYDTSDLGCILAHFVAVTYDDDQKALYLEALNKPQGMFLVTGPTGSGKTVSLYTGLNILNTPELNIST